LKRKIGKYILVYGFILMSLYLGFTKYQAYQSEQYVSAFRTLKGEETIDQLAGLYKEIIEYQATYKLTPQAGAQLVQKLLLTGKRLKDVDQKLKEKYSAQHVDFSYVYQDLFLVTKQIQDKANDAKLSVMVVHAVEGLGNVKIQIYRCDR
jgi:hypothetical protein